MASTVLERPLELSELFNEPFEPSRSIQLNNRYWVGEKFTLLPLLAESEALVGGGKLAAAARLLGVLRKHFVSDKFFFCFLRRLHRLRLFRSEFGCIRGKVTIGEDALQANQYRGTGTRASYSLSRAASFARQIKDTANVYTAQYGVDLLRVNSSVRFARPDERRTDIEAYGQLSDYHNDEYKGISTIVYLSEVRDDNGAFSYIAGSHLIPRSLVLTAIHQCVEFDMRLTTPEQLAAVPLEFRGSLAMGNFLDSEKVEVVSRFCEVLEGGVGTFVTFNGQYVIHRGGKPRSGSRTAAFFQPEGLLLHKAKSVSSLAFAAVQSR